MTVSMHIVARVCSRTQVPKDLSETPFEYVSTTAQLEKMCEKLSKCSEIGVDLEHHSFRTYQGFTCLIQISTRSEDFIVDALTLRHELHVLNEIFANPKIVKVFHGADMDIIWLQRDFGVYVVNMFDTGQASRLLDFAHYSLSYLMRCYCNRILDKQYQLADWRMRPLASELLKYAREDTHYLLYVYDRMKNDLLAKGNVNKNLLKAAWERSKLVCLKRYEKPMLTADSHLSIARKSSEVLNSRQMYALRKLYEWRDRVARSEDESTG